MEGRGVIRAFALVGSFLAVPLARGQVFSFRCPDVVAGTAGELERVPVACVATVRAPIEICGYSVGVVAEGGTVVDVGVEDLGLVPGGDGFRTSASLTAGGGAVVHAVAPADGCLPFLPSDVLPLAALEVEVRVPGSRGSLVLRYLDGLVPPDDALVDGPATNRMLAPGREILPDLQGKHVVVAAGPEFRRGDLNDDGRVDISDVIFGLEFLFRGRVEPGCRRAADANDDDRIDIADIVYILVFRFRGGPAPVAPYPRCGLDLSDDALSCTAYRACASAALSWVAPDRNADGTDLVDLAGFIVHYGPRARGGGEYQYSIDVGRVTRYTISGLPPGRTFFAVTAYDWFGNESEFSDEVSAVLPPRE